MTATQAPPTTTYQIGDFARLANHVVDARDLAPDMFVDLGKTDWSSLDWKRIGRPYRVEKWAKGKGEWEREHGKPLPVHEGWQIFNRNFQGLFDMDVPAAATASRKQALAALARFDFHELQEALGNLITTAIWNRVHRVDDAVWDPRGKRALFQGLDVKRPRILFLGASDGYEGMQLAALYPGAHVVLVDYDEYCVEGRFGAFPARYPFLGADPATGGKRIWYREEMTIDYDVADIRDLRYGNEFDIVLSVGLIEHFPDEHKSLALEMHRRFLRPGGYAVLTTPRNQLKSRAFYNVMSEIMNYGYRELMDVHQMGRYVWESGFDILRAGVIKAHNGIVARPR